MHLLALPRLNNRRGEALRNLDPAPRPASAVIRRGDQRRSLPSALTAES